MAIVRMDPFSEVDRMFEHLNGSKKASRRLEGDACEERRGRIRAPHREDDLGVLTRPTMIGGVW